MSMNKWAEEEVRIACKRENPDKKEGEFDYGCACYESALKAYKSLCEDGHSGMSFGLTKNILIRLLNSLPLTPIEDTPENWNSITIKRDGKETFQCNRMSSLFKDVFDDGTVRYNDVNRTVGIDLETGSGYHGFACKIVEEMFPITMPYYPSVERYEVYTEEFVAEGFEGDDGDYNTTRISHIITPEKEKIVIDRFFGEKNGKMIEINGCEYAERLENKKERE